MGDERRRKGSLLVKDERHCYGGIHIAVATADWHPETGNIIYHILSVGSRWDARHGAWYHNEKGALVLIYGPVRT